MPPREQSAAGFVPVAEMAIDAVRPSSDGFELSGRGADRAEYRVEVRLEMPLDHRTRTVVGELLAQSALRLSRRTAPPLGVKRPSKSRHARRV